MLWTAFTQIQVNFKFTAVNRNEKCTFAWQNNCCSLWCIENCDIGNYASNTFRSGYKFASISLWECYKTGHNLIIVNFTIAFETRDLHLEKSVQTLYGIYTSDIRKLVALYNNTMMSVSQWTKSIETSSDTNFKYKKMNKLELFIKFFNLRFTVFIMTMLTPL